MIRINDGWITLITLYHTIPALKPKAFDNIVGKGENTGNYHFLLFPQCFLYLSNTKIIILATFILLSANAFNLDFSKILSFGKALVWLKLWHLSMKDSEHAMDEKKFPKAL